MVPCAHRTWPRSWCYIQALYNAALRERGSSIYFQMLINRTSMPVPQQPNVQGGAFAGFGSSARGVFLLVEVSLCSIHV